MHAYMHASMHSHKERKVNWKTTKFIAIIYGSWKEGGVSKLIDEAFSITQNGGVGGTCLRYDIH